MSNIFSLSEASSIALHSMVLIAKTTEKLNVIQISERIGSSKHHVAKVMQRLAKVRLVESNRGPSGGFYLQKDPAQITLLEIYEAMEGKLTVHHCMNDREDCPFGSCLMGDMSQRLGAEFKVFMESRTLRDYMV